MRRCTILEGIHQEAKLSLCLLRCETKDFEHSGLQLSIVNTDRSSTDFHAVDNHIISIGTHSSRVSIQQWNIFFFRMCKRMVHSHQTAFFLTPFEHWEVNHPKANKLILITQSQLGTHFQTEFTKLLTCFHHVVAGKN